MHSMNLSQIIQNMGIYQPVLLCSYPAKRDLTRKHRASDAVYYKDHTKKLLKRKNIQYKAVSTTGWYSEISYSAHTATPEVLVRIENHFDIKIGSRKYSWKWEDRITENIFSHILTDRRGIYLDPVTEFVDKSVEYYPIQQPDPLFPIWGEIRSAIMSELDITQWYSLELFRINRYPALPVVSIKSHVIADIQETSRMIQDILLRFEVTDGIILMTRR